MPKVLPDPKLKDAVERWIAGRGLSQRQAASEMGVTASSLCRFLRTACALDRTRSAMLAAIDDASPWIKSEEEETNIESSVGRRELNVALLREMLRYLTRAVDAFERSERLRAQSGGTSGDASVHPGRDPA